MTNARRCCEDSTITKAAPLRRAIDFIEANLRTPLTLAAIADTARVHITHLARLFRAKLGYTVAEYIRRRRIEEAQRLLVERPEWHLSNIAAEMGFADHAHFSRTFRRDAGVTPSAFRRQLGGGHGQATAFEY